MQSTDPGRLSNKEGSRDAQISLGRRNRKDFVSDFRGEDGNMSNQTGGIEGRVLKEMTGKGDIWGSDRNLTQGKLPRVFKDDPS